jgi:hypothetical protein
VREPDLRRRVTPGFSGEDVQRDAVDPAHGERVIGDRDDLGNGHPVVGRASLTCDLSCHRPALVVGLHHEPLAPDRDPVCRAVGPHDERFDLVGISPE